MCPLLSTFLALLSPFYPLLLPSGLCLFLRFSFVLSFIASTFFLTFFLLLLPEFIRILKSPRYSRRSSRLVRGSNHLFCVVLYSLWIPHPGVLERYVRNMYAPPPPPPRDPVVEDVWGVLYGPKIRLGGADLLDSL